MTDDILRRALRLLALGLCVIRVPRPRPGVPAGHPGDGKVPDVPWRPFQDRLSTESEVRTWFSDEPVNIAIVTGAVSGIVVIDVDSPDALRVITRQLPYTPWQVQTGRGFHLYYRHPGVRVPNRARIETRDGRLPVDVRGDGGYVITIGSIHASGAEYLEAGDWSAPRERVPVFWPGWLRRGKSQNPNPKCLTRPTGDLVERARAYLAAIPRPEIGQGSDNGTLYAACRLVRGFGLSAPEVESLLWEWAGGRTGWTRDWIARKVRHAEQYGTEPIGALQ
jgi:hypothetical protein